MQAADTMSVELDSASACTVDSITSSIRRSTRIAKQKKAIGVAESESRISQTYKSDVHSATVIDKQILKLTNHIMVYHKRT